MYTGKRFRLKQGTLAIEGSADHRTAIMVPGGETVLVLSGPRPDDRRMADVLWDNRALVMFVDDIEQRSEEVRSHGTA